MTPEDFTNRLVADVVLTPADKQDGLYFFFRNDYGDLDKTTSGQVHPDYPYEMCMTVYYKKTVYVEEYDLWLYPGRWYVFMVYTPSMSSAREGLPRETRLCRIFSTATGSDPLEQIWENPGNLEFFTKPQTIENKGSCG